jgi:hypothetical protein
MGSDIVTGGSTSTSTGEKRLKKSPGEFSIKKMHAMVSKVYPRDPEGFYMLSEAGNEARDLVATTLMEGFGAVEGVAADIKEWNKLVRRYST